MIEEEEEEEGMNYEMFEVRWLFIYMFNTNHLPLHQEGRVGL
jgi:hypothetical protein